MATGYRRGDGAPGLAGADGGGSRLRLLPLYIVVFVCGAVLMCIEIAGSRMLAPTFGSDIFTWGSIIGVFMMALAAGYYSGGVLVDRVPRFWLLCLIVAAAGLVTVPIPWIRTPICQGIADENFGPRLNPLVAAIALYLVPSTLIGMVAPFAVRLAAKSLSGIGNVAGRLYALSTVGSILGTLLTAFLLIPSFGTRALMWSLGLTRLAVAAGGALWQRFAAGHPGREENGGGGGRPFVTPLLVIGLLALGPVGYLLRPIGPGVYLPFSGKRWSQELAEGSPERPAWKDSAYHLILVTEQEVPYDSRSRRIAWEFKETEPERLPFGVEWRRRRLLRFNNQIESSVFLDESGEVPEDAESAAEYVRLLHMGVIFHPKPRKVLVVGCGGGVGPMQFRRHYGAEVDVVDIDEEVFRFARNWMGLREDRKLRTHVRDGRRHIECAEKRWDYIILDAYTSGGRIPFHLTTKEFFESVREHLEPGGVLVSNVISAVDGKNSDLLRSVYKTLLAAGFATIYIFPRPHGRRDERINVIMVAMEEAASSPFSPSDARERAAELAKDRSSGVRVPRFVEYAGSMDPRLPQDMKLDDVPLLTDDYAPVDAMYAPYD